MLWADATSFQRIQKHSKSRKGRETEGLGGSNPPLSATQSGFSAVLRRTPRNSYLCKAIRSREGTGEPNIVSDHVTRFPASDPSKIETFKVGFSGSGLAA